MIALRHARLTLRPPRLSAHSRLRLPPPKEISSDVQRKKSIRQGPGKHWLYKPAVIIRRDGKEVCNVAIPEGYAEYHWRVMLMWIRQEGACCNCRLPLALKDATFEHENGRGAAKRDDRIALYDEDGRFICHINGASHSECNRNRGSRRTELYHGNNAIIEVIRRSAER